MKIRALCEAILCSKPKPASKMSHVGQARIYQLLDETVSEQNIRFSTLKRLAVALAPSIESDAHTCLCRSSRMINRAGAEAGRLMMTGG